jgi:NitT/TauT family transport system substrate-binding protein
MKKLFVSFIALVVALGGLAGCSAGKSEESVTLRIGTGPIMDVLSLYLAEQENYFQDEGVTVEIVPFVSARDTFAAMQAEEVDGVWIDFVTLFLLNNAGTESRMICASWAEMAQLVILSTPDSPIRNLEDLRGVDIAIGHNTISEFVITQILRAGGLDEKESQYVEVAAMPLRLEMLSSGQVEAVILAEPLASLAVYQGAHFVVNDAELGIPPGGLFFRQAVLEEHPEAIRALLRATNRAIEAVNAGPDQYEQLFFEKSNIPEVLRDTFTVPHYSKCAAPGETVIQKFNDWMVEKGLLESPMPYERLVDGSFLP